jgi:S-methylmethionine-dependent homocysteine/selenocysteine methylase
MPFYHLSPQKAKNAVTILAHLYAYPRHFQDMLNIDEEWRKRIRAIRANASKKSHAELDEAEELDAGDSVDMGNWYRKLNERLPNLNVFGGCCGTDQRHVERIAGAVGQ